MQPVEFSLNGNSVGTVMSDSSGHASIQLPEISHGEHFWSAKAEKTKIQNCTS